MQSSHKHKPLCTLQEHSVKLSCIYQGPIKSFFLKPNVEAIYIIHAVHHDTQCIMEMLSERCLRVIWIGVVNGKAVDMRGDWGRRERKMWKSWTLMNRRTGRLALALIALMLFICCFLTLSVLASATFPLFLTLLFYLTLHPYFTLAFSLSALQIPLFIPSLLSLSLEAHVHSIYHHLSMFIWSAELVSGLCCCCCCYCCCSEERQLYPTSQKQEEYSSWVEMCWEFVEVIKTFCKSHKGILGCIAIAALQGILARKYFG